MKNAIYAVERKRKKERERERQGGREREWKGENVGEKGLSIRENIITPKSETESTAA